MVKRVVILGIILAPFAGNILWTLTRLGWLYWGSRYLIHFELIALGILCIFFPRVIQKLSNRNVEYESPKATMSRKLLGVLLGVIFIGLGYFGFYSLVQNWIIECGNHVIECLKYY
jgi:hypothetical protein